MGMADCGLTPNLETDISETGCAAWRPVSVCGQDHDLIAMTEGGVQFGVRPADNDMCTADKRPTARCVAGCVIRPQLPALKR